MKYLDSKICNRQEKNPNSNQIIIINRHVNIDRTEQNSLKRTKARKILRINAPKGTLMILTFGHDSKTEKLV